MSERITDARVPGIWASGLAANGRLTREEMIAKYRAYWTSQLERAETVLATPDESIKVATYIGMYARRNYTELST